MRTRLALKATQKRKLIIYGKSATKSLITLERACGSHSTAAPFRIHTYLYVRRITVRTRLAMITEYAYVTNRLLAAKLFPEILHVMAHVECLTCSEQALYRYLRDKMGETFTYVHDRGQSYNIIYTRTDMSCEYCVNNKR